jgi:hypothetical protein
LSVANDSRSAGIAIRKTVVSVEEVRLGTGKNDAAGPLRRVIACAVISNPFAGKGYVEDLSSLVENSVALGEQLGKMALEALGEEADSYGKAAIVGMAGDQEHGVACLTSAFGDAFRKAIGGGKAWISSTSKLGGPGTVIDVPLAYKDEIWVRSHYDSVEARVGDAPAADEIVVIAALANRGRLNARLGGMSKEQAIEKLAQG